MTLLPRIRSHIAEPSYVPGNPLVLRDPDCWLWTASLHRLGYGQTTLEGRNRKAHQVVWEALRGPIPVGLELDHLCRTRRCVNPAHLEPVTHRENCVRAMGTTHCSKGHPRPAGTNCPECARTDEAKARHRAVALASYHRRKAQRR